MSTETPIISETITSSESEKILIDKIKHELIEPQYYSDIKSNLRGKTCWKDTGDVTETIAHVLIGVSAILSFASGSFDNMILAFVAGCVSVGSGALLLFSKYSMHESKERTIQVNRLLKKLGMDEIENIIVSPNDTTMRNIIHV